MIILVFSRLGLFLTGYIGHRGPRRKGEPQSSYPVSALIEYYSAVLLISVPLRGQKIPDNRGPRGKESYMEIL